MQGDAVSDEHVVALSALQHYLYCPRQCALIHVEQLWEESRHTAEGRVLHERADKPKIERRKGVRTVTAMPLAAPALGISGIADVVEFHQTAQGEQVFPVEYKRGKPKAHRADEVQLCAQALCLEAMLGQAVSAGALYYGQTRRRSDVAFDKPLRQLTQETITAVRAMVASGCTPGAQYSPRRCDACSLMDLCQPKLLGRAQSVNDWLAAQLQTDNAGGT